MSVVKTIRTDEGTWAELQRLRVALGMRTMNQVLDYLVDLRKKHVRRTKGEEQDGILALAGLGRELWKGVDPDEYVRDLRKGW